MLSGCCYCVDCAISASKENKISLCANIRLQHGGSHKLHQEVNISIEDCITQKSPEELVCSLQLQQETMCIHAERII